MCGRDYIVAIQMPSFLLTWVVMFLLYVKIWKEARMCARRINLSIVSDLMEKNNHRSVQVRQIDALILFLHRTMQNSWI